MDWRADFGHQIRKAREARGLSQEQLADTLSVSRPQLSNYENGKNAISAKVAAEIAKKLDKGLEVDGCEISPKTKKTINSKQLCLDFDKDHKFGPVTIRATKDNVTVTTVVIGNRSA